MLGYVISGGAAAAAVAAGYESMAPTGQWYGRTFTGLPRGTKQIALTYDDGPNDPDTLRLLEVLARHQVHATFFLIGRYVQQRPDIVRDIAKAGHAIGNHTFTHPLRTNLATRTPHALLDLELRSPRPVHPAFSLSGRQAPRPPHFFPDLTKPAPATRNHPLHHQILTFNRQPHLHAPPAEIQVSF